MKISIIIPSYRQPQFLGRAIESCLEQDHRDLEVIVVEDRSRDASLGLAVSFTADDRVKVVECDMNGGLGKARNIGVAHATGEYLCFLDSDDYLLDRSLSSRVEALPAAIAEHGDGVVGVYGDWQHVGEAVDHPTVRKARSVMPLVEASTYTGENVFICSAPLVHRDAVVDAGGFPEGLPMLEDFALWARMIAGGAIFVPVHHVVATYRQRPNSMLRGDGVVVMADHVDVINGWMSNQGVGLADGGAMSAWLADQPPLSYGRLTWNLPSVLGNFGQAAGANAVHTSTVEATTDVEKDVANFMSNPQTSGSAKLPEFWVDQTPEAPTSVVIVHSVQDAIDAVAIADQLPTVAIAAHDPQDWSITWPLALAGRASCAIDAHPGASIIDLSGSEHRFADRKELTDRGLDLLWPKAPARSGSVVYVPKSLHGYPALDAWVSTALHALADAGHEPHIVCDPSMRSELAGFRSSLFSVEALRSATLVVAPDGPHLELVDAIAPNIVFAPSSPHQTHARTRTQLEQSIRARSVSV